MKKLTYLLTPALVVVMALASCDKDSTTTTPTPTNPTNNPTTGPTPQTPAAPSDAHGALVAINMKFKVEQLGFVIDVNSELGVASFFSSAGNSSSLVDGGTVKLNSNEIEKQSNNSYFTMATTGQTPSDLGLSKGASWEVAGNGNVPAISYNHGSNFPEYTGDVPASITKANGLSLKFNSSNTSNADSVYVFIASGNATFIKSYAANAGSITISSSELNGLPDNSDNTAILEILPVKTTVQTFSGKKYAFIKEEANVRYITIK